MLLKSDPIARRRSTFYEQPMDDGYLIRSEQDVEPVMEANHEMRRHFTSAKDPHGEWGSLVGRIPVIIWEDLMRRGIAQDEKALLKWLQDSDNRAWKIHPGRFV